MCLLAAHPTILCAPADPIPDAPGELLPRPSDPTDAAAVEAWRQSLKEWRDRIRAKISYNGSIYTVPELMWAQNSRIEPQMRESA